MDQGKRRRGGHPRTSGKMVSSHVTPTSRKRGETWGTQTWGTQTWGTQTWGTQTWDTQTWDTHAASVVLDLVVRGHDVFRQGAHLGEDSLDFCRAASNIRACRHAKVG